MNPNILDNRDTVQSDLKNSEKLAELISERVEDYTFSGIFDRLAKISPPLLSGRTEETSAKHSRSSADRISEQLPIIPINNESLELSFFIYGPTSPQYSRSITANWHIVGENENREKTDKIALQEHLKESQLTASNPKLEKSERLLQLIGESVDIYENARRAKRRLGLRKLFGAMGLRSKAYSG